MLHILLAILKIIGVILAVILGLLILLVLVILTVPVRYKLDGRYERDLEGWIKITWLLHILTVKIMVDENRPEYYVKIFGIRIRLEPNEKKINKRKKKEEKQKKKRLKASKAKKTKSEEEEELIHLVEEKTYSDQTQQQPKEETKPELPADKEEKPKQNRVFLFLASIPGWFKKIKYTILSFCGRIRDIKGKIGIYYEVWNAEENQVTKELVKTQLKKLLNHIKPKQLKGTLYYGTEDPALTGQILGIFGMLYPVYREHLQVYPDFTAAKLSGDLYAKGRIRAFPVLLALFKIYRDKNIKKLLRHFRN